MCKERVKKRRAGCLNRKHLMSDYKEENPVNPLPAIVVALALIIVGIELVFVAGNNGYIGGPLAAGWRVMMIENWGFRETLFDWMVQTGKFPTRDMVRFVTYPFFHINFMQLIFVLVFLLAFGKVVGERLSPLAVLAVFFTASIVGALAFWLVWDTPRALFGGMPAVYGLLGAYTYISWRDLIATGGNPLYAFRIIAILMMLQLIFGLYSGVDKTWVAEIAGFCAGFGLSVFVTPGGWSMVLAALRKR